MLLWNWMFQLGKRDIIKLTKLSQMRHRVSMDLKSHLGTCLGVVNEE